MNATRMSDDDNVVTRWFGAHFADLDPLLQQLHRRGGRLQGMVDIAVGAGIGGWLGRRLARRLGIPLDRPRRGFEVGISHAPDALIWARRFDNGACMTSRFEPIGCWPDGAWIERTGPLQLRLGVSVEQGDWRWLPTDARVWGVPLPLWLLPRFEAGKRVENGCYVFHVRFALPLVGTVLSYQGRLEARAGSPALTTA